VLETASSAIFQRPPRHQLLHSPLQTDPLVPFSRRRRVRDYSPLSPFCPTHYRFSGIPLLTGDQDYEHVEEQEEEYVENADKVQPFLTPPPASSASPRLSKRDSEAEDVQFELAEGVTGHLRRKRQTWVFVTHNTLTNDSQYREFKFEQVARLTACGC
jgi:hypothetical protein